MNSLQESAWLAGLLEGEGCFSARARTEKGWRTRLEVQLQMTDRDVVDHAIAIMPTEQAIYTRNPNNTPSAIARKAAIGSTKPWSTSYAVTWNGQKAENVMRRVYPYMGERRKDKIHECLNTPNLSHHSRVSATV